MSDNPFGRSARTSTVAPATMTFDLGGAPVTQTGAVFSVALRRLSGEWRIVAWAWAKGQRTP